MFQLHPMDVKEFEQLYDNTQKGIYSTEREVPQNKYELATYCDADIVCLDINYKEFYKIISQIYKDAPEIGIKFQYDLNKKALEVVFDNLKAKVLLYLQRLNCMRGLMTMFLNC